MQNGLTGEYYDIGNMARKSLNLTIKKSNSKENIACSPFWRFLNFLGRLDNYPESKLSTVNVNLIIDIFHIKVPTMTSYSNLPQDTSKISRVTTGKKGR